MKKIIILLSVLFLQITVFGQYKPMLESGNVWTQHYNYWTGGLSDSISMSGEDSLINGLAYYKLDGVLMPGNLLVPEIIGNPILAREDTTKGKVWIYVDSIEYLLFDFSLMLGDTVTVFTNNLSSSSFCDSLQSLYVTNVDTFVDMEGTMRREVHLKLITDNVPWGCYYSDTVVWIEGIGAEYGFNLVAEEGMITHLLCAWKSGVQLFQGTAYGDTCWAGSTIGVETFEKPSFDIYPNPAIDEVVIRSKSHPIQSVKLYDLRGNALLTQHNQRDYEELTLNITGLASGMYVLCVESLNGAILSKKLRVQ